MTMLSVDEDIINDMELSLSLEGSNNCENPQHHIYAEKYAYGLLVHSDYTEVHWCHYVCPCGRDTIERRCVASIRYTKAVKGFTCLGCYTIHDETCMTDIGPVKPD